ncbi:MAG TPA: putative manganese-dependent inorganic diphosphatase [Eggerthellaceae bacterium]|nr:putative manganese-dependent inorganic diphosphatase [Eggerthellaceae bacterium]
MTAPIIVVGHKNPDNDAISAAIGYAWLKNELVKRDVESGELADDEQRPRYVPARLGPLPPETAGILDKWGIEAPMVINNLFARVSDVMTPDPLSVGADAKIIEAGRIMRKHNIQALVVTNDDGTYRGLVSTRMIANRYISATDVLEEEGASEMSVASDLIASLDQRVDTIMEESILTLAADGRLDEAVADLMNQPFREAVVLDDEQRPIGIVTRSDIAVHPHRKVVLVDHNEISQAAAGIEDAEVVEIIDHHRIADVSTVYPIKFLNMPVGSTATIVTLECQRYGIEPPAPIAAVLLSAVMTDTVVLKSPTATATDERIVDYLAGILDVKPLDFGMDVFSLRGGDDDMPIDKLVSADSKEFDIGEGTVLIAQHETTNLEAAMGREQEMRDYMRGLIETHGYVCVLLMLTDIIAEGSQFLCEGNRRIVNRAFDIECTGVGGTWMPGVLSRKKQVAARILEA